MKTYRICLIIISLAVLVFGNVPDVLARQKRDIEIFDNSKAIKASADKLRASAEESLHLVDTLKTTLQEKIDTTKNIVLGNIEKFRDNVSQEVTNTIHSLRTPSDEFLACVQKHRGELDPIINNTIQSTLSCVLQRTANIYQLIENLTNNSKAAVESSNYALQEMQLCVNANTSYFVKAACLARISLGLELKAATFLASSGLLVAQITFAVAILPTSVQTCATTSLIEAALSAGKVLMEISACSIYNIIVDNKQS